MKIQRRKLFKMALLSGAALAAPRLVMAQAQRLQFPVIPLRIQTVTVVNGQLVANALLGNRPLAIPLNLSLAPNQPANAVCPVLNLQIAPISLNLLGLAVNTSAICLTIEAIPHQGLLGDILCAVAHLLDGGLSLTQILNRLTGKQFTHLLIGLRNLLNDALLQGLTANTAVTSVTGSAAGACDILNLQLGPLDLKLLGLHVHLDNCQGGPVTLSVRAIPGAGNLLGNLLCSLANLLNGGATTALIDQLLGQIAAAIGQLLA